MSSQTTQFAFPVECHGDKFTCRKTPVIPNLIDVDLAYHDTVLVEGKKHVRHLMHVYYMYSDEKMLKCDFFVEVNRDNIAVKMLEVLKNYVTHINQYHKKKHFFSHIHELMSLSKIKFEKAVHSSDFDSREEMAADLDKYLKDKEQAQLITDFLKGKSGLLDCDLEKIRGLARLYELIKDVPKAPLVGVEQNPGPPPDLRPDIVARFAGPGYLFCGCGQDALGRIVHLCVTHANYLAEHADDMVSSDESDDDTPEDDVPDEPLVGVEPNPGPDLVNLTPSFALHGNYVGPGHTGAKRLGDVDWSTKPIDALDAAARSHDWHYSQQPANRGAADEVLAKRAWRSIAKQDGLVGKAKAAFVAAGMKAMSLIGSRNGTLLLDPPAPESVHPENKHRSPNNFTKRKRKVLEGASGYGFQQKEVALKSSQIEPGAQINGNNGSATNSDDVPKNMQPKKERKIEKKIEKKVEKTVKKQKKQKKNGSPKKAPIQTGLTATTFQETSSVQPYYLPGSKPRSKKTLFSLGIVSTGGVSSGSTFVSGGVNQSIAIDKNTFSGQSIGRDLDNYEMGQLLWAKYWFVPSIGSTTPGACWIFSDPDAVDVLPVNTVVQNSLLTSHRGSKKHTIWKDAFSGPCVFNKKWLYLDSALNVSANTTANTSVTNSGDPRLTTFGVLNFINGENISTSTGALGEWFLECEFDFMNPQFNDLSNFILSQKLIAPSSTSNVGQMVTGTAFDPFRAFDGYTGAAIQYENVINPRLAIRTGATNGTGSMQFKLPPGNYNFYCRISQGNGGSSSTYTPVINFSATTGTIYSLTMDKIVIGIGLNSVAAPEFASALISGADPLANGAIGFNARLRIDSVPVGTTTTVSWSFVPTLNNTFYTGAMHLEVTRMPDLSASPICAFHPQGNAVGFVGLTEDVRIAIWNGLRVDEGSFVDYMICPRQFIDMVKDTMMKRYLDHDEKYCFVYVDNQKGDGFPALPGSLEHWLASPELYVHRKLLEEQDKSVTQQKMFAEQKADEPESPELVVNPLSTSVHLRADVATRLLNLVSAARSA